MDYGSRVRISQDGEPRTLGRHIKGAMTQQADGMTTGRFGGNKFHMPRGLLDDVSKGCGTVSIRKRCLNMGKGITGSGRFSKSSGVMRSNYEGRHCGGFRGKLSSEERRDEREARESKGRRRQGSQEQFEREHGLTQCRKGSKPGGRKRRNQMNGDFHR